MTPATTTNSSQLTRQEINQKQKEFVFPSVTTYYSNPVPMDHALMQHVWDVDGKRYLDFFGGIVTISVGHCNPRVISRTKAQIDRLHHVSPGFRMSRWLRWRKSWRRLLPARSRNLI